MKGKALVVIIVAVLVALGLQNFVIAPAKKDVAEAPTAQKESAYDRVMRTNTLRCAYAVYAPWVTKDPNTGKLGGIVPEILGELERASGLKVEWGPEIDWGNIAVTLQSGKADAFCAGMYMTPKRGRVMAGSTPIFFGTVEAYVRQNDTRFDNNVDLINKPDVNIEVNAGDLSEEIAQSIFPNAKRVYKGEFGGEDQLFLDVATGKADVTLSGPTNISTFNAGNPSMTLRKVALERPLVAFASVLAVDLREASLLPVINASLHNLIDGGVVERIMRTHTGTDYGNGYFAAKPQID
jgi:ABC-type amino acid transport substrate-binding protein